MPTLALLLGMTMPSMAADGATSSAQLRQELLLAEVRALLADADDQIITGHSDDLAARLTSLRARLAACTDNSDAAALCSRLDRLQVRLATESQAAADRHTAAIRTTDIRSAYHQRTIEVDYDQNRFHVQMSRIQSMLDRGHCELALAHARQLVAEYPAEPEAEKLFETALARTHAQRSSTLDERRQENLNEVNARIERALIPSGFDGLPAFPSDWDKRMAGRQQQSAAATLPAWEEELRERLEQRLSVDYNRLTLAEVLHDLETRTHINFILDPQVTANDTPVSFKAQRITVGAILSWACRAAGINWEIARGAVYVGSPGNAQPPVLDFYDVADLLHRSQDQSPPHIGLQNGIGATNSGTQFTAASADTATTALTVDGVIELITASISPQTWKQPGCGISAHNRTLLITAPRPVHDQIRQLLKARANLQTLMVNIEMRWLELDDAYLEEIGVSWGNANSPIANANSTTNGLYRTTSRTVTSAGTVDVLPASLSELTPSSTSPTAAGLQLSTSLLKATQLNATLKAMEMNGRGTVLSSPSLATINGSRSYALFARQIAYIGDYDVSSYNLRPKVSILTTGALLDIKPLVSADGKYVTLTLQPQLSDVELATETIYAPITSAVNTNDAIVNGFTNATHIAPFPLQLPVIHLKSASTQVMMPDNGGLLVGGFGKHWDQNASTKVPLLGHIPFLGRLFGTRGRYSDRRQVYLLATVHIINYQELEATL
jgi:hypothetical protein